MNLDRTRHLIHQGFDQADPKEWLIQVLESAIELVDIPDNDFAWSSWETADDARKELNDLIVRVKAGDIPERLDVSVLFGPTGPLQEVSLSSGWAETFLKVAERFDELERSLWNQEGQQVAPRNR